MKIKMSSQFDQSLFVVDVEIVDNDDDTTFGKKHYFNRNKQRNEPNLDSVQKKIKN